MMSCMPSLQTSARLTRIMFRPGTPSGPHEAPGAGHYDHAAQTSQLVHVHSHGFLTRRPAAPSIDACSAAVGRPSLPRWHPKPGRFTHRCPFYARLEVKAEASAALSRRDLGSTSASAAGPAETRLAVRSAALSANLAARSPTGDGRCGEPVHESHGQMHGHLRFLWALVPRSLLGAVAGSLALPWQR